jgi:hypothetical protein
MALVKSSTPRRHLHPRSLRELMSSRPRVWMHLLPSTLRPFLFGSD